MRGYWLSPDPYGLRRFRAHGFPGLPSLPVSVLNGKGGGRRFESVRGLQEVPADRLLLLPVRRRLRVAASTERPLTSWIAFGGPLGSLLVSGVAGIAGDVHPASTALSIASASNSETTCSRL